MNSKYICIDLKSFYASVECVERGLDPMTAKLVVADRSRSDKTICLAVSPALKKLGIKGRCRLFEIPASLNFIVAEPRMKLYIDYASRIYDIYLGYLSREDIHVYSIDEVFMYVEPYFELYGKNARQTGQMLMKAIYEETGLRSACGVGSNLYLAKIAMDITAKHSPDFIGELDEESYINTLWDYRPITDFWRIGNGTASRLQKYGITTMRGIASADYNMLFKIFGVDAELLIDHAWGRETVTIADIKRYIPKNRCLSRGQVLMRDYGFREGEVIVFEMMESMCYEMLEKGVRASSVSLYVGYAKGWPERRARGSRKLDAATDVGTVLIPVVKELYRTIVNSDYTIKKICITCGTVSAWEDVQGCFFEETESVAKARILQKTALDVREKYGKNAIFKGIDLQTEGTTLERNSLIGGHKSGIQER